MTHIRTLGLAGAAALLLATPAHAQRQVNAREDASATGTVEIEMNSGSVRVTGWSRNEVQVTGSLARADDRVEMERAGRAVEVRVTNRRGARGGPANLEIRVPAGSTVEVSAGSAPITVTGVTGSVEAMSQSGPVTVQGSARRVEVVAQSGPVTIEGQAETLDVTAMSGPVRVSAAVRQIATIEALSGPVELLGSVGEARVNAMSGNVHVANAAGPVEIEVVSGNVTVNGTRLRGNVQSVSGNLVVGGSVGGALTLESHGGNVELRLPSGAGAEVEVETFSGGLRSDFGGGARDGGGRERHVTVGRGGPTVSITTFSGDVKLLRR
jgi:Putative adhesin